MSSTITKQRWAFSEEESKLPFSCNGYDELIAEARDPDTGERLELGVIVYRNGEVSNRWEDGTVGVPSDIAKMIAEEETLYHPVAKEETYVWINVEADGEGNLIRFNRRKLMTDYRADVKYDAQSTIDNFADEILEQLIDKGEASDDLFNDYPDGDRYYHENHVDRDYSFSEACEVLKELSDYEETDSGLWDGQDMKTALSTCAAFTYSNAVDAEWCKLIKHINCEAENIINDFDDEAESLEEEIKELNCQAFDAEQEGGVEAPYLRDMSADKQKELDSIDTRKREELRTLIAETTKV